MSLTTFHEIPYALTADERNAFFARTSNAALDAYLASGDPPYGIIVQDTYGTLLVWIDQTHALGDADGVHVIDVTNMPIVTAVQQAPYESPDSGFWQNTIDQIKTIVAATIPTIDIGLGLAIIVALVFLVREVKRS